MCYIIALENFLSVHLGLRPFLAYTVWLIPGFFPGWRGGFLEAYEAHQRFKGLRGHLLPPITYLVNKGCGSRDALVVELPRNYAGDSKGTAFSHHHPYWGGMFGDAAAQVTHSLGCNPNKLTGSPSSARMKLFLWYCIALSLSGVNRNRGLEKHCNTSCNLMLSAITVLGCG